MRLTPIRWRLTLPFCAPRAASGGRRASACLLLSQHVLEIAPSTYTMVRGGALLYLGVAAQMEGNQAAGFARLQVEFSLATGRDAVLESRILIGLAAMQWAAGDLSAATRTAVRHARTGRTTPVAGKSGMGSLFPGLRALLAQRVGGSGEPLRRHRGSTVWCARADRRAQSFRIWR